MFLVVDVRLLTLVWEWCELSYFPVRRQGYNKCVVHRVTNCTLCAGCVLAYTRYHHLVVNQVTMHGFSIRTSCKLVT